MRVLDTIQGTGAPVHSLGANQSITVQVTGPKTVPTDAAAIFANVYVHQIQDDGSLRIGPAGSTPSRPVVNYSAGAPNASGASLPLSADGRITILNAGAGSVDLAVDAEGYFSGSSDQGGGYHPLESGLFSSITINAGASSDVAVGGTGEIPKYGSSGAFMTLTATSGSGTGFGHLKAFRTGAPAPSAALMGWDNGDFEPVTTSAIIRPGNEGDVTIQNTSDGPVTISISAQGWFAAVPIIAPDMQQDFVETAAYAGLSSDFANQAIYDNEMASQILKPPAPEDVPMPADVPTESSDPAPQDQGAATVDGYFKTYGGDPVPNMTVHLGVAGSAPEDGSEEPVPVVGTAVTDDAGKWTYTMPVPLPPSLQAYADANGGVLNVVATVSGTEPDRDACDRPAVLPRGCRNWRWHHGHIRSGSG